MLRKKLAETYIKDIGNKISTRLEGFYKWKIEFKAWTDEYYLLSVMIHREKILRA